MAPKKSSKASGSTPAPVVENVPTPTEVVSPSEPVDVSPVEVVEDTPVDKFELVLAILNKTLTETKEAISLVKTLQKEDKKSSKKVSKRSKKEKSEEGKASRPASGFAKPTKLSDALCSFLGVPAGTEMSRTDVTRVLNQYIKTNSLQDVKDKRTIVPDEKLTSILDTTDGKLTYFTLQKHIKHHFIKA
jgi:chromatin remodeling complex protein RSC6